MANSQMGRQALKPGAGTMQQLPSHQPAVCGALQRPAAELLLCWGTAPAAPHPAH